MFKGFLISQECILAGDGGKFLKYMIFLLTCEGLSGENTMLSENELIQDGYPTDDLANIHVLDPLSQHT